MVKYQKVTCKQLEHRGKDSMMHQTQQRDLHQQDWYPSNQLYNKIQRLIGLFYVSGKLPTCPFPKQKFCAKWEVSVDVGLGEG